MRNELVLFGVCFVCTSLAVPTFNSNAETGEDADGKFPNPKDNDIVPGGEVIPISEMSPKMRAEANGLEHMMHEAVDEVQEEIGQVGAKDGFHLFSGEEQNWMECSDNIQENCGLENTPQTAACVMNSNLIPAVCKQQSLLQHILETGGVLPMTDEVTIEHPAPGVEVEYEIERPLDTGAAPEMHGNLGEHAKGTHGFVHRDTAVNDGRAAGSNDEFADESSNDISSTLSDEHQAVLDEQDRQVDGARITDDDDGAGAMSEQERQVRNWVAGRPSTIPDDGPGSGDERVDHAGERLFDPMRAEEEGHLLGSVESESTEEAQKEMAEHDTDTGLFHIDDHGNKVPLTEEYIEKYGMPKVLADGDHLGTEEEHFFIIGDDEATDHPELDLHEDHSPLSTPAKRRISGWWMTPVFTLVLLAAASLGVMAYLRRKTLSRDEVTYSYVEQDETSNKAQNLHVA